MNISHIRKRNGDIAPFDINRILIAITKAHEATNIQNTNIVIMVDDINKQLREKQQ